MKVNILADTTGNFWLGEVGEARGGSGTLGEPARGGFPCLGGDFRGFFWFEN